jgi:hypothetical protein
VCVTAVRLKEQLLTRFIGRQQNTSIEGQVCGKNGSAGNLQDTNTKESNLEGKKERRRVCIKRNVGLSAVFYVEGQCRARSVPETWEGMSKVLLYQGKFMTGFYVSESIVSS